MADVQEILTRKAGPLPVWGWAAIGGGLVSVLYLRGRAQSSSDATGQQAGDTSSGSPFGTPIIVTPSSPTTPATPDPSTTPAPKRGVITGNPAGVFNSPSSYPNGLITLLSPGTQVTLAGPPVPGASWGGSNYWQPVDFGGQTAYVHSQLINIQTGLGGGSAVQTMAGAGEVMRFASPVAPPQFVPTGMGGGGPAGLRAVARRTGIPVARVMALNPGHWRGGRPPAAIHIR